MRKTPRIAARLAIAIALLLAGQITEAAPVVQGLAVWLDASDVDGNRLPDALADGTVVATWVNKANPGTNNAAASATPSIINAAINDQPVIRFTGAALDPDAFFAGSVRDSDGAYQCYIVSQSDQTDGMTWQRLVSTYDGTSSDDYLGQSWSMNRSLNWSTGAPTAYNPMISSAGVGSGKKILDIRLGRNGRSAGQWFDGDMAEVMIYDRSLNSAEDVLVRNYLAAKYDVAPGATDRYAGDTSTWGDYDLDVIGIGRNNASNEVTAGSSAGLALAESGDTLGDGEWLLAGHKGPVNSWVSADVPPAVLRSDRVWYLDKTGALDATLTFDLSEAGLSTPGEVFFQLLYSPTNAFAFSDLHLTPSITGDQVSFIVPNGLLLDGYYTLAAVPEPSALLLALLGLGGVMRRVGRRR